MHKLTTLTMAALLAASASAQIPQTLVFTGRFDFIGADTANERVGGSINDISEFAISIFTPAFTPSAISVVPAAAHHAWMGDAYNDNNYVRLEGFKTTFERFNFAGPFIKSADKSSGDVGNVYWTVRDAGGAPKDFTVLDSNGSGTVVIRPGDFFRWDLGGNVEFFVRQADLAVAAGPSPPAQSGNDGASAICQDALGNLYYSPPEGGHWVNGNSGGPIFLNDGSIAMIPAAAITYDAAGNVSAIQANSAIALFAEVMAGSLGGPSVRAMVTQAGANDYSGNPTGVTANIVGLEIDPNGGTIVSSFPSGSGTYDPVPNLIFTWDSGSWASTIFSTADTGFGPGSIAVINGVQCGETAVGAIPDPTAWLGCALDVANFTPTTMGIALMDIGPPVLVADMPSKGALDQGAASWDIDFKGAPSTPIFMLTQPGPSATGAFAPAVALSSIGLPPGLLAQGSYPIAFTWPTPQTSALVLTDAFGYGNFNVGNPWSAALVGSTLLVQGIALEQNQARVSNPIQLQLR